MNNSRDIHQYDLHPACGPRAGSPRGSPRSASCRAYHLRDRGGPAGATHTSLAQGALAPMTMHWRAERRHAEFAKRAWRRTSGSRCPSVSDDAVDPRPLLAGQCAPDPTTRWRRSGEEGVAAANARWRERSVAPMVWARQEIESATRPAKEWLEHFWEHDVAGDSRPPSSARSTSTSRHGPTAMVEARGPSCSVARPPARVPSIRSPLRRTSPVCWQTSARTPREWRLGPAKSRDQRSDRRRGRRWTGEGPADFGAYVAGPSARCSSRIPVRTSSRSNRPGGSDALHRTGLGRNTARKACGGAQSERPGRGRRSKR